MTLVRTLRNDRGTIAPFIVGCFVLGLLLIGTTTDIAVVQLDRRTLQAQADATALAAAQAADLRAVYSGGVGTYVPIDPDLAMARARTLLGARQGQLPGFRLDSLTTDGRTVFVRLSARITPPFLRLLGQSVRIDAQARAMTSVG